MAVLLLKPAGSDAAIEVELDRRESAGRSALGYRHGDRHAEIEVEITGPGAGWLRQRGAVIPYYAVRKDNQLHVWLAGRVHTFEILERSARRATGLGAAPSAAQSTLTAPMPGTILKINIAAGQAFTDHQPLIIMESMKMEMTLSVPHAGRVKEVTCRVGQLVDMGALLARLEPADEAVP